MLNSTTAAPPALAIALPRALLVLMVGLFAATGVRAGGVYGDLQAPLAGRVYGTAIHTSDAEELRFVVLQQLTQRYAAEQGITVTQAERRAFDRRMQEGLRKERDQRLARRDALTRQLATGGLPAAERAKLSTELDTVNQTLAALGADASADTEEDRQAREQVAEAFVHQWKVNRALYHQYGGRIVFQQGGPEPLDAYRKFLQQRLTRGDFAIYDKAMEAPFWHYYLTDSLHSFYPRGSKQEAEAFKTPFWEVR